MYLYICNKYTQYTHIYFVITINNLTALYIYIYIYMLEAVTHRQLVISQSRAGAEPSQPFLCSLWLVLTGQGGGLLAEEDCRAPL